MVIKKISQHLSQNQDQPSSKINGVKKILMLPDYSRFNPYQRELVTALEEYGVHVTLCSFNVLPILRALWVHGIPDILHLHWTDVYFVAGKGLKTFLKTIRFFMELFIVKALGVRVVWTVHNLSNHEKINAGYETFINQALIKIYDQVIVHCLAARESVIQFYRLKDSSAHKLNVIPHGHYIDCYPNEVSRRDARVQLGYDDDAVIFLFLGSIRPYKGLFELIDVFCRLENANAKLLIVGNPSSAETKTELLDRCKADPRIQAHLAYVPDDELQIYMNASNVAVFPYTDILTSGSVLLAMSFGKPIVVPRIGCIAETLDSEGGFLYDPGDMNGFSQAMRSALASDLDAMGRHNRINVEYFDWKKIAQLTLDVYSKSAAGK